ncbi:MAG: c-type cytochrome [Planctomycetaceae bacterium]|nr:c-type cytochrome [Planctomycetaceae bacterium]
MSISRLPCLTLLVLLTPAAADEPFPRVPPTEPEQAEATFEVLHGFRMQLIAAEPHVASPVDVAYDEDGRAYVVEMRDYPYPEEKNTEPKEFPGTVRLLADTDGDGRFDQSTIFADQLAWPTSACCWKGGVFVAAAPDIWYFKDTNADGKADVRRKVFTGFGRYNVQAIMNNLRWGLDNKIYGAAAGNGGKVVGTLRVPSDDNGTRSVPTVDLSRRDFRFDPVTEKLEAISGGERFGNTFDDWGNRFVCNIRNPVQHVVLEQRYLARNPHFVPPSVIHDCAESGDQLRVFRLSPPEPWRVFRAQRWALEGQAMPRSELIGAGYWTSSSGVTIYRGGAYPPEFRGNVFIGEVAGNLVHRQVLTRDGVTFKSRRADENTEFIRSRDNWFRPVNFVNAPDGTLHVIDMYRETIEHPWSIPDDIKAKLDLTNGKDRGRIYRVAPPDFTLPKPPKLSTATTAELVAQLESPHSWYRETAQRLLIERQDQSAAEALREVLRRSPSQQARLHALHLLNSLAGLTKDEFLAAMVDDQPDVRRHALALAETQFAQNSSLVDMAMKLTNDSDAAVRMQVALAMGQIESQPTNVLTYLGVRYQQDPWLRAAIASSAVDHAPVAVRDLLDYADRSDITSGYCDLTRTLASIAAGQGDGAAIRQILSDVARLQGSQRAAIRYAALAGLGEGLSRRRERLSVKIAELDADARDGVRQLMREAGDLARTDSRPPADRVAALYLVRWTDWSEAHGVLLSALEPVEPREVQQGALRVLATFNETQVAAECIARWKRFTPPLREESVNVLLSRPLWHEALIAALENGDIPPAQLSIPQRSRLGLLRDEQLAARAKKVLAAVALGPRKDVLDKYQAAISLRADAARGAIVYRRECVNCHKFGGEGQEVGPNLATIQHRSPQEILIHVLDPNREVSPNFLDYSVRLADGRVLTGLIAAETDAGLTLRRAENREDTVLRSEIEEITSSGKSLMPEGLEQKISQQEMADLIEYLRVPINQTK